LKSQNTPQKRRVLITGGSSGIGLHIAQNFLRMGADVALVARDATKLAAARDQLTTAHPGSRVMTLSLDIANLQAGQSELDAFVKDLGGLDILVNNAGSMTLGRFSEISLERHVAAMEANYTGHLAMTHRLLPAIKESKQGRVVFVSSVAGFLGIYGYSAYSPAKFAMTGLAECLRQELIDTGVTVSVAFPPDTETPMHAYEKVHGLAETKALSGKVKPKSADFVARRIVSGAMAGKFEIFFELESPVIRFVKALTPKMFFAVIDRIIR